MYKTLIFVYIQVLSLVAQTPPLLKYGHFRFVEQMRLFIQYRFQRQEKSVHVDGALALNPFALPQPVFVI